MPYIKKEDRKQYDDLIDDLSVELEGKDNDTLSGHLNYVLFRLAGLLAQGTINNPGNYARLAVIRSSMKEANDEFHRKVMVPYEDRKIKENGDVEL